MPFGRARKYVRNFLHQYYRIPASQGGNNQFGPGNTEALIDLAQQTNPLATTVAMPDHLPKHR
jgi:hypothetical protein